MYSQTLLCDITVIPSTRPNSHNKFSNIKVILRDESGQNLNLVKPLQYDVKSHVIIVVIITWTAKFAFVLMLEHDVTGIHTFKNCLITEGSTWD